MLFVNETGTFHVIPSDMRYKMYAINSHEKNSHEKNSHTVKTVHILIIILEMLQQKNETNTAKIERIATQFG